MGEIDFYWYDLSDSGKKKVLAAYNINKPEEANLDVFPIFSMPVSELEEDCYDC